MVRPLLVALGLAAAGTAPAADPPFARVVGFRTHVSYTHGRWDLAFSADGRWLAVGGSVVSVEHRAQLGPVLPGRGWGADRVVFSPDGARAIAMSRNPVLVGLPPGRPPAAPLVVGDGPDVVGPAYARAAIPGELAQLDAGRGAAFTPDGADLVAASHQAVERRSLATGRKEADARTGMDVRRIYPLGKTGSYLLWSAEYREPWAVWDGKAITVDACTDPPLPVKGRSRGNPRYPPAVSADGADAYELVDASGSDQKWLYVWDLRQRKVTRQVPGLGAAAAVARLADGAYAVGYRDGKVEVRDAAHRVAEVLAPGRPVPDYTTIHGAVREMAATPDGRHLAVLLTTEEVVLYSRGGTPVAPGPAPAEFPARPGTRWEFARPGQGVVQVVGGVEVIGAEPCVRVESYTKLKGGPAYAPFLTQFYAFRADGVYEVGETRDYGVKLLTPALPWFPTTPAAAKGQSRWDGRGDPLTVRVVVRPGVALDTPFRAGLTATRVDREVQAGNREGTTTSVYLVNGIGPVRLSETGGGVPYDLVAFTP